MKMTEQRNKPVCCFIPLEAAAAQLNNRFNRWFILKQRRCSPSSAASFTSSYKLHSHSPTCCSLVSHNLRSSGGMCLLFLPPTGFITEGNFFSAVSAFNTSVKSFLWRGCQIEIYETYNCLLLFCLCEFILSYCFMPWFLCFILWKTFCNIVSKSAKCINLLLILLLLFATKMRLLYHW